jgi:hypothetical protein
VIFLKAELAEKIEILVFMVNITCPDPGVMEISR